MLELLASATAYSLYDHILTLDREVKYIWSGKFGMHSFFFILNRYGVECGLLYACYSTSYFSRTIPLSLIDLL